LEVYGGGPKIFFNEHPRRMDIDDPRIKRNTGVEQVPLIISYPSQ
jgi:hypothetical protein